MEQFQLIKRFPEERCKESPETTIQDENEWKKAIAELTRISHEWQTLTYKSISSEERYKESPETTIRDENEWRENQIAELT